jgi:hypothetical protein
MLCAGAFLAFLALLHVQGVAAQTQTPATIQAQPQEPEGGSQQSATCGQTRSVLVRFLDGRPVPGVEVTLIAASQYMGGPELNVTGDLTSGDGQQVVVSPLATPHPETDTVTGMKVECRPVITGTLTAITDPQGLVHFDLLGEGAWVLHFDGEVSHDGHTAYVVPAPIQGLFPQGRTRAGGGFIEQITSLNEEGGPNARLVQPDAEPATSRYLLGFSQEYGGWLPGLDLASADNVPPVPLAAVTVTSGVRVATVTPVTTEQSFTNNATQDSSFDATNAKGADLVPGANQSAPQLAGQASGTSSGGSGSGVSEFDLTWAVVLGLVLGGVVAIVWARRANGHVA